MALDVEIKKLTQFYVKGFDILFILNDDGELYSVENEEVVGNGISTEMSAMECIDKYIKELEIEPYRTGTITGINAPPGSGGITIYIDDVPYVGDNGPTVRSLDAIFGDVITEGHGFDPSKVVGKEVKFYATSYGLLEGLGPVD